jgi:hypothetical protein
MACPGVVHTCWYPEVSCHQNVLNSRSGVHLFTVNLLFCSLPGLQRVQESSNPPVQRLVVRVLKAVNNALAAVSRAITAKPTAGRGIAAAPRTQAASDAAMRELLVCIWLLIAAVCTALKSVVRISGENQHPERQQLGFTKLLSARRGMPRVLFSVGW